MLKPFDKPNTGQVLSRASETPPLSCGAERPSKEENKMMQTVSGPRPKESSFYEPMVYLLGKLTGFKPYVGVPHETVQDDVLRLAGIDPENCPWPLKSTSSKKRDGLYRVVHFAWYHQTRQYRQHAEAYCGKPIYGEIDRLEAIKWEVLNISEVESDTLTDPHSSLKEKQAVRNKIQHNTDLLDEETGHYLSVIDEELRELRAKARGEWALTELGVKKARALKDKYEGKIVLSAGPNITARYLGTNWNRLWDRVTSHLRRKMPRSEEFGKIEDHAMNWMERTMQRDGLRTRIEAGKSIPPSQVQAWARRGAYTDIRNEGREPVCRSLHGALTKKEIGQHDPVNWTEVIIPRTINDSEFLTGTSFTQHSEDDFTSDTMDLLQDDRDFADVEGTVLNENAFENVLGRVAEIIRIEIDPGLDPDFHEQIMIDRYVKEMTVREIADAHGLKDERQITLSLNRVRDAMLRAREGGDFDDVICR